VAYKLDMSMMFAMHDALRRDLERVGRIATRLDDDPAKLLGLGALAAVASAVTKSQLSGHAHAVALTNGYTAGLLAGAAIYAVGAIAAALAIDARLTAAEAAAH
jgi:hypothetical protein